MEPYSIGKYISYIQRINQKELTGLLKPYGIGGGGHHSYLKTILHNPGLNQDQLTNEVKFDKATTTRCVKQLEEEGYVERTVDGHDRRSYRLYPTQKAKDFEPTLGQIFEQFNRHLTECLTEAEQEQLAVLLQKIYDSKLQ
ncbi:MarR family winged helix-turn-helix transcriptional regulator [Paenibacillus puldeungensis]|uniref:MarR family winged helix-turn-helix transcriptional regulator n=1 Tax=Paenibacillus puldeungensis TaxID=696536 RepID=A0ABW3S0K7_9BACL